MGILWPQNNAAFADRDKISVRVRVPITAKPELRLNGQPIDDSQIGQKQLDVKQLTALFEYVSLPLVEGQNTLALSYREKETGSRPFGQTVTVWRAKRPTRLEVHTVPHQLPADGETQPEVLVRPVDDNGVPVMDGVFVTVRLQGGEIVTPDANPVQDGHQLRVEGEWRAARSAPAIGPKTGSCMPSWAS